jgi:hypothetical protein
MRLHVKQTSFPLFFPIAGTSPWHDIVLFNSKYQLPSRLNCNKKQLGFAQDWKSEGESFTYQ